MTDQRDGQDRVLLLDGRDVAALLARRPDPVTELIDVIERALGQVAGDKQPRGPVQYPARGGGVKVISVMGQLPGRGVLGGRINALGRPRTPGAGGHRGYKLLFDAETLNLRCIMEDGPVHPYMVGAHVGVATRWLARADAHRVAVLGSGAMALSCLRAICAVREVSAVKVYSPNPEHRAAFAAEAARLSSAETEAAASGEAAVAGSDIVTCATNNHFRGGEWVFKADWLAPGTHVNTISRSEADEASFTRLKVFPPSWPDYLAIDPAWGPLPGQVDPGDLDAAADLARVIAGRAAGRTSDADITLYAGPSIPAEHLAVADWVYGLAAEAGIGTSWVQQEPGHAESGV